MKLLVCALFCMAVVVKGEDQEAEAGGVTVKVLGQSGKIRLTTGNKTVTVEMDEMKERDTDGNEVGKTGSTKHVFNTFASQDFTFGAVEDTVYNGVKATKIEFTATDLVGSASLKVPIVIFKEAGNFTIGTTDYEVLEGNVKFNLELMNWGFCGSDGVECKQGKEEEIGDYIEFVVTIKGSGEGKKVEPSGGAEEGKIVYELGDGERLYLATEMQKDGTWEDMRTGFPKMEVQGGKQKFSFAFQKFDQKCVYDPSFSMGGSDPSDPSNPSNPSDPSDPSSSTRNTMSSVFLMLLVAGYYFL